MRLIRLKTDNPERSKKMSRKLDKVYVVDVEATCWKGKNPVSGEGVYQHRDISEIIQVGMVELNTDVRNMWMVSPGHSIVSEFCTELTGISELQAERGYLFPEFCNILKSEYPKLRDCTWASWGDYDRVQFGRNCELYKVKFPFGRTHINVKNLFALKYGLEKEVGITKALAKLAMSFEGRHHDAMDDASNAARILRILLSNNL